MSAVGRPVWAGSLIVGDVIDVGDTNIEPRWEKIEGITNAPDDALEVWLEGFGFPLLLIKVATVIVK